MMKSILKKVRDNIWIETSRSQSKIDREVWYKIKSATYSHINNFGHFERHGPFVRSIIKNDFPRILGWIEAIGLPLTIEEINNIEEDFDES